MIEHTLAVMNLQSPTDLGWTSPHPHQQRERPVVYPPHPQGEDTRLSYSSPSTPFSPSTSTERLRLEVGSSHPPPMHTVRSISTIVPSRSPEARKSAGYISSLWRERFGSTSTSEPKHISIGPPQEVPSGTTMEGISDGDQEVNESLSLAEIEEKVEMDRVEYELALAIERKNTLLNLKKMLRANADAHVEEQRKIIQKERLEAAEHFERVQESLSIAICARILQESNKTFGYGDKSIQPSLTVVEPRNDAFLPQKLLDEIQLYVREYKQEQNKSLELEMETRFHEMLKREEEYVNGRRRYWRELAKKDADEAHMLKIQEELMLLQDELSSEKTIVDTNSMIKLNEKSILEELYNLNPQDFLDAAKRKCLITLQHAQDLIKEVAEGSEFSALEGSGIIGYLDKECRKISVKDASSVSTDLLLKLIYEEVASLGKVALSAELSLQRLTGLMLRFQFESAKH